MAIKVFSFVISADFGFFKKPDINKSYLTYNFIPKTVVLGILGAILGLNGYNLQKKKKEEYPEFYTKLKRLLIGIKPLGNFPYKKIINKYNNSTGHASKEEGGNLIISEQLLINPSYKIYVGLPNSSEESLKRNFESLAKKINEKTTTYILFMGKNDFPMSLFDFTEEVDLTEPKELVGNIEIETAFLINSSKNDFNHEDILGYANTEETDYHKPSKEYLIMENYPYSYDKHCQYKFDLIKYTNQKIPISQIRTDKGALLQKGTTFVYLIKNDSL